LSKDYNNDPILEYQAFYKLGIDGVFTDFTDTAIKKQEIELLDKKMAVSFFF
jgi:glycerophosphoryl diester phosphodiesterase